MVTLRVELIGDRVGVLLDEAARASLNVAVGDSVSLRPAAEETLAPKEIGDDGRHERGRAFLKRYRRALGL